MTDTITEFGGVYARSEVGPILYQARELNHKLAKRRGITGQVEVHWEDLPPSTDPFDELYGRPRVEVWLSISGLWNIPGYRLRAVYEFVAGVDTPTRQTFGADQDAFVHPETVDPRHCDHCGVRIARKRVFALTNEAGDLHLVGSNCFKDFSGHSPLSVLNVRRLIEDEFDRRPPTGLYYDTDSLIVAADVAIQLQGGYVKVDEEATGAQHQGTGSDRPR